MIPITQPFRKIREKDGAAGGMGRRGLEESYPRKTPAQAKLGRATLRSQMNASAGPAPAPAAPSRFREFQIYKRPVTGLE